VTEKAPQLDNPAAAGPSPRRHLAATRLLDYGHRRIAGLIADRGWAAMSESDRIAAAYAFVRDEIPFGYNASDDLPASRLLADGYGQCNTKATLLMALLRAVGIPCRAHFFTIHKALQLGAVPAIFHWMAPDEIIHSWVEVWHGGRWLELEGFILDRPYLARVQARFAGHHGPFCGYGIATPDLADPPIEWTGGNTYIQRDGIARDLGVFDAPDDFYRTHDGNFRGARRLLYRWIIRHAINRHVRGIRNSAVVSGGQTGQVKEVS
jgi:Transglutaminase-like superfamily